MVPSNSNGSVSRPGSSATERSPSSASRRPPSTGSAPRASGRKTPVSYAPDRPLSSTSTHISRRPVSRASTRQSARLLPLYETLVTQVTGIRAFNDEENFHTAVEYVTKSLSFTGKGGPSMDLASIQRQLRGHVEKARIQSNEKLATALKVASRRLATQVEQGTHELDTEIQISHIPDHVQLLLILSAPPSPTTLEYAQDYVENITHPPPPPPSLTWRDILADEPFEGQHWDGVFGLEFGSIRGLEGSSSGDTTPSLSPARRASSVDEESISSIEAEKAEQVDGIQREAPPHAKQAGRHAEQDWGRVYAHRRLVEDLQARQYWRPEWNTDASIMKPFDIGDASTLGPSLGFSLGQSGSLTADRPEHEAYIHEHDAVREILMAMQGRKNLLLEWNSDGVYAFLPSPRMPRLLQLTFTSQCSLLKPLARFATDIQRLRQFVSSTFAKATASREPRTSSRTLEAFAEAIDSEIQSFQRWCSEKEENVCRAYGGVVISGTGVLSLLSLEKELGDNFGSTYQEAVNILASVLGKASRAPEPLNDGDLANLAALPIRVSLSSFTTLLLDTLLDAVHRHSMIGRIHTSETFMRIFICTVRPTWDMTRTWLQHGPPHEIHSVPHPSTTVSTHLDPEFYIEDNGMQVLDPDFWTEGYVLRGQPGDSNDQRSKTVLPKFLRQVAPHVLSAGKSVGLLRALSASELESNSDRPWLGDWKDISFITQVVNHGGEHQDHLSKSWNAGAAALPTLVFDHLVPQCRVAQAAASRLVNECGLWEHFNAIESVYLMARGDAMSRFAAIIFARMDSDLQWHDFHFMNSAFRDTAMASSTRSRWIDSSLVRFSYRRRMQEHNPKQSVYVIDGLMLEYAVPFPLTYICGPKALRVYNSIFVFMLQIRRAKSALERTWLKSGGPCSIALHAMRSRLLWFVNTLLTFISTNIIQAQVLRFREDIRRSHSLDEMIDIHNDHLAKLQEGCLLVSDTVTSHQTVLKILDKCLYFSECYVAFTGGLTLDATATDSILKHGYRHRSRRFRKERRNVVGFSTLQADHFSDTDSDSEENEFDDTEPTLFPTFSASLAPGDHLKQLETIGADLDGLVRLLRRGVAALSCNDLKTAPYFEQFAFALEDWDL
ncbi:hypothetical protein PUNSTDRAFT_112771 [Punctularia strigosozonata HHB-11173 SS5]|uniref:uncharacterized protein n=1 Tax=Punctularia strigosozonata (strain HHB-11173) TaxID=741275 RepID=UPI0004417539|nr:uncharacterized protein PUNSTDRAFT_112771 [Punctularia strigosozonata HHB-11173 SS5]EIN10987.1 hypothetical protein PUNSTDRAFT_112771 [Punctularia strigosozonata HHB-11173 SS5]